MKNEFEVRGDITVIFIPYKGVVYETYVSTCDIDMICERSVSWNLWDGIKISSGFRAFGTVYLEDGTKTKTSLHRLIMNPGDSSILVDHIDGDPLNNTRNNLRLVNHQQNQQNRKGAMKNSKSGIRGVSWSKTEKKWRAQIAFSGRNKHLGWFKTIEEAEKAAIKARAQYYKFSKEARELQEAA